MNCYQRNEDDPKRSVAADVAVGTAIIYSIGIVVFFANLTPKEEIFAETQSTMIGYTYFMLVLNCVALIFWVWGIHKKKSRLMVTALIVFGLPLNLWTGQIIVMTTSMLVGGMGIPKNKDIYENNADIWSVPVTAFFVGLYFTMITCYRLIKRSIEWNDSENPRLCDGNATLYWKCAAIAVCWLILAFTNIITLSIFIMSFFFSLFSSDNIILWWQSAAFLVLVSNFVFTIVWLTGVNKNSTGRMLATLLFWALLLVLWIFTISWFYQNIDEKSTFGLIASISFWIIIYSIAVLSYLFIRKVNRKQTPQNPFNYADLGISYTADSVENP